MDDNEVRGAPLLLGLQTCPLAITLFSPHTGQKFIAPLTQVSAQALALALLAQPGVGGDVLPAVLQEYLEQKATRATGDNQFLSSMGVSSNAN
jgi:hypothetical protein